jgi:uncharacterized protein DUF4381
MIRLRTSRNRMWPGPWLCLIPSLALAQASDISVAATADRKNIELSESLAVTLVIEGPAPLRVELPKQLLVPEAERDWKIQTVGQPILSRVDANRERWVQVFRLDPFDYGQSMAVVFAPVRVNGREVAGAGFQITVEDPRIEPKATGSMRVTGLEQLPPQASSGGTHLWWWLALLIPLIAASIAAWRLRKSPKPLPPREWALVAFTALERDFPDGQTLVTAIAAVLRSLIERQFGIPAPKLTTEELLTRIDQSAWPVEHTDPLRRLLEECDRAKFAADVPDHDGCQLLLTQSREWVDLVCPEPQTR